MTDASERSQRRALMIGAWIAIGTICWLASSVGMGILFGALFAITFQPWYERLRARLSPALAATTTVGASTAAVALTLGAFVWILVRDGVVVAGELVEWLGPGGSARKIFVAVGRLTSKVGLTADDLEVHVRAFAKDSARTFASAIEGLASATASIVLVMFFQVLTMYFVLRRSDDIVAWVKKVTPLRADYTIKLLDELRRVGRSTLVGNAVSAFLQGALAAIGYWIFGLPHPLFLGVLSAIASLVPGLGTLLVWVPAGIALMLLGRVGSGVGLLVYGVIVITSIPTYVVLPRIVGQGGNMPALFMFVALFGGVGTLGLKGLVIGPVLTALAFATIRLYADEAPGRA